ncbi:hypothetical protein [Paenibacillus sp. UASWS1643]|uniref:hypothetical protein n=1 Tax=Paenibacillus sp. UASWS1643 TaxID=2580422 RepID=UPI00123BA572|nr:hypothetical protein [Paenibacillus sp. UASWS1643]KAA8750112.1 hypothetical protein FE296_16065 [Paenibacillus sp. UASWS1643]
MKEYRQHVLTGVIFATVVCWFISGILFSIERLERIEYYNESTELLQQTKELNKRNEELSQRSIEVQKKSLEVDKEALEFYRAMSK